MSKSYKIYNILNSPIYIPLNDIYAWQYYPSYRWVYNKLALAEYQNIKCAPMPIKPEKYPIIIKPIINMYGMGLNTIKINNEIEFFKQRYNNNFWMEFIKGEHLSWDLILINGQIKYHIVFRGIKDSKILGKFKYWVLKHYPLPNIIIKIITEHFSNYSGCINIETINNIIIEMHLRMGDLGVFYELDIFKGIINAYQNIDYNWDQLLLPKIYQFPIWINSNTPNIDRIFIFINRYIKKYLRNNKHVIDFYIDDENLASPDNVIRLLWFSCYTKKNGKKISRSILDKIDAYQKIDL